MIGHAKFCLNDEALLHWTIETAYCVHPRMHSESSALSCVASASADIQAIAAQYSGRSTRSLRGVIAVAKGPGFAKVRSKLPRFNTAYGFMRHMTSPDMDEVVTQFRAVRTSFSAMTDGFVCMHTELKSQEHVPLPVFKSSCGQWHDLGSEVFGPLVFHSDMANMPRGVMLAGVKIVGVVALGPPLRQSDVFMVTLIPSDRAASAVRAAQLAADVIHYVRACIPDHTPVLFSMSTLGVGDLAASFREGMFFVHIGTMFNLKGRARWVGRRRCVPLDVGDAKSSCAKGLGGLDGDGGKTRSP